MYDLETKELVKIERNQENSWKSALTEPQNSVYYMQPLRRLNFRLPEEEKVK